jgi:protease-3
LLRVPVKYAFDSSYLADRYNPKAIVERLDAMTPQNARIGFISPSKMHNNTAYS